MKTYTNIDQVKADIHNGVLAIDDDIEIAFDGFCIKADIKCRNIYSKNGREDIIANSIIANNIIANNINANSIIANNINAKDINARDINAGDINYHATCISYKNITCTSIKGRRENSFHKCLDGELTIKPKVHTIEIDGKKIELSEESFLKFKEQFK